MYIIYIRERHSLCLVCTIKEVIKKFEVKVVVQKGPLRVTNVLDNNVLASFN